MAFLRSRLLIFVVLHLFSNKELKLVLVVNSNILYIVFVLVTILMSAGKMLGISLLK